MAHTVEIKEIDNGVQITDTLDGDVVVKVISHQAKPFLRTTNEDDEVTYQVLDKVGEIYNIPALATEFIIIDKNDVAFIPADGIELIEYSKKIRAFRPDDDRDEVHHGTIGTTSNSLTINLASDNVNWAYIDGSYYERYYPDTFNFTPVTTGQKIIIVYAVADELPFRIAQGAESTEAVEPDYDGLFVARIIVDSSGQIVEEEELDFKERAEDAWRNITIAADGVFTLNMGNSLAASFSVNVLSGVATPTIGIIRQKAGKSFWDGSEFWIHNISNKDIILYPSYPTDTELWKEITFTETTIVKAESWAKLKIKYGELVVIEMGGGAEFPEGGVAGNILEFDAVDGAKWSGRLTDVETNKQDKSMFSSLVDKMVHYYDSATQKMLSTGVEFISAGILKVKSIILTTNSGTALANELGTDGTNVVFGATKKKLAFKDEIFEHNVRGKRVEATVSGTYNIDLNAGSHFSLTATTATTISFSNMILSDETCAISMTVTGQLLTMPAWLIRDANSDLPDAAKTREYTIIIKKGGVSPSGRYNVINM